MLSLKKLEKEEYEKKQSKKIAKELPFFITIVALLAASGSGPYTILQKLKEITLLPITRFESLKILKKIDMLGLDPLVALSEAKDKPSARALGDFLGGYVSAIQSGGNVVNYLKSKMVTAFELLENAEKQAVENLSGIVHAWLTTQIVVLSVFILLSAISSNALGGASGGPPTHSDPPYALLVFSPVTSLIFIFIVRKMNTSNTGEIEMKKILKYGLPSILASIALILSGVFASLNVDAYILGVGLIGASVWPAIKFKKMYALNLDAEAATPQILRDITEARKAGMGPEKCVIHACKRKDFKLFNAVTTAIANKLEWGVPLENIFGTIQAEIKNFQVLISFRILFEIITSGGGNVNTLDSLADTSEKVYTIEKNKRDTLKVYAMVGFMLITVTGFTTLLTIQSFADINQQKDLDKPSTVDMTAQNSLMEIVAVSIVLQAWLSGFFIGKITKGSYSGGFLYAILITDISLMAIALIQLHIVNFSSIMKSS